MCKESKLHPLLAALPKCEHHLHIEGTLEPSLLFSLAAKNKISLPSSSDDEAFTSPSTLRSRYAHFTSLEDFLHYYFIGMSVLITSSDFEELAYSYFRRAKSDGVVHAEIFFDPQAHISRDVSYTTVLAGLEAACRRAEQDFQITSLLIPCILRHLPVPSAQETFDQVLPDLKSQRLAGLGLSSTEIPHPPKLFAPIYQTARTSHGITNLTAHAGEEADVSYMASALHDLGVVRVDHGIKLHHSAALMREFVDRRVLVTVCPVSNLSLRCVDHLAQLPLRTYLDAGVCFSLNSDDPAYFGGGAYVLDNFCAVQDAFDLSVPDWETIVTNAIEGSWCGEDRKAELRTMLADCLTRFSQ